MSTLWEKSNKYTRIFNFYSDPKFCLVIKIYYRVEKSEAQPDPLSLNSSLEIIVPPFVVIPFFQNLQATILE